MIIINNLTKKYDKITALNNVNFIFPDKKVTAIMGENGAGKSTLLKICAGVISLD
jgi:ABC-type multidrug transport system ATPase subunit